MQGIVVTGAFGYLGMALLRRLRGRPAVGVGHPPRAAVELPAGVEAVYGDLSLATVALGRGAGALVHLAEAGGDTDTNAAVAGALLGARDGDASIPPRWLDQLGNARGFSGLAERLLRRS